MSSLKIVELTESNTCKICENAVGKYSCPKCNVIYCSVSCYQSEQHSECSEGFYKECVLQNLEGCDESEKKKVTEMLQKFHETNKIGEESSGDESCESDANEDSEESYVLDSDDELGTLYADIGERLAGIDLDDSEEVWDKLNETERQEFEAFLMSGDVGKYITMWVPWWEYRCEKKLVEVSELEEQKAKCPKIREPLKLFSELCEKAPATCVEHNLMNVVAAYAFTLRYFNGDYTEHSKEAASYIFNLSMNLKKNQDFTSFNQAVNSVTLECTNGQLQIVADKENVDHVKSDVHMILSGPHATEQKFYLLAALSDMLRLFEEALKPPPQDGTPEQGSFYKKFVEGQAALVAAADELERSAKKLEYFLAYAKDCYV